MKRMKRYSAGRRNSFFTLITACMVFMSITANAQEGQALYNIYASRVVYLQHELYVDGNKTDLPELWKRFEEQTESPFLSNYITVSSGSGFFIDYDGHFLTNSHVVDIGTIEELRKNAIRRISESIDAMTLIFTPQERDKMKGDLETLLNNSEHRFSAMSGSKYLGTVDILANGDPEKDDIALGIIKVKKSEPLSLAVAADIDNSLTGLDVYSMGYPLGDSMQFLNKQRVVTMNRGNISAYRANAKYDVQHSAPISSGNSGGPLISERGVVYGMNTAMMTKDNANSLFYAISTKRIRKFLSSHGYEDLLIWGDRQLLIEGDQYTGLNKNKDGEYESPSMLIVSVDPNVVITLNGTEVGTGQQLITLTEQINDLVLTSDEFEKQLKIRYKANLNGPAVFTPVTKNMLADIEFTSEPSGRRVHADGRFMGVTPFSAQLPEGQYSIVTESDEKAFKHVILDISEAKPQTLHLVGTDAYPVHFADFPNKDILKLKFEGSKGDYVYHGLDDVFLPPDEYILTVTGAAGLKNKKIPVAISNKGIDVDLNTHQRMVEFSIRGYVPDARVWIDGTEQPQGTGEALKLSPGVHSVSIWHEKWQPMFSTNVTVDPEKVNFIVWDKQLGVKPFRDTFFLGGIVLGSAGLISSGLGLYFGQNDLIVQNTDNYQEYKSWKDSADLTFKIGVIGVACGIVSEFFAWRLNEKYKTSKKEFGL